jgi:putative ABC transport system permease protein
VLRLDLGLDSPKYRRPDQQTAFYQELISRMKGLPGVESVGATTITPLGRADNWCGFEVEGRPTPAGAAQEAGLRVVSEDYFRTLRIPLRRGRVFSEADRRVAVPLIRYYEKQPYPAHFNDPQAAPAVVINETMARIYWPNEDPLGKRLRIIASPWITVVGVVGDVHHNTLDKPADPEMFLSDLQEPSANLAVLVRTSNDPLQLAAAAREQVKLIDKDQPVTINTMDDVFSSSVAGQRFNTLLLGAFASLSLMLAMIGVFSVINYSVTQRTREIGIRLALGAPRGNIFKLIVGKGLALAVIGVVLGSLGALGMTRLITGLLFDVSPTDASTFATVSVLMTAVAGLACYLPARRATKVDPLIALRYE